MNYKLFWYKLIKTKSSLYLRYYATSQMTGPSLAQHLGNAASKKRRNRDESLATLCPIWSALESNSWPPRRWRCLLQLTSLTGQYKLLSAQLHTLLITFEAILALPCRFSWMTNRRLGMFFLWKTLLLVREVLGFIIEPVESDTVSPKAFHRCDVPSWLSCTCAMPRRWTPPPRL